MQLKVIGTGSSGNAYLLIASNGETVLIEQGLKYKKILPHLEHGLKNVVFMLCSHLHGDHSVSTRDFMEAGIDCVIAEKEYQAKHIKGVDYRKIPIAHGEKYTNGDWTVWAFNIEHDTPEPLGFVIDHPESGRTLFLTDTCYIDKKFPGINNMLLEANFCDDIMQKRLESGSLNERLAARIRKNHLSLNQCLSILEENDLSQVNNICLIHLSDGNSHAKRFQETVYNATLKNVTIAEAGLVLKWNRTPWG